MMGIGIKHGYSTNLVNGNILQINGEYYIFEDGNYVWITTDEAHSLSHSKTPEKSYGEYLKRFKRLK